MAKTLGVAPDYVLKKMSYANVIMYSAVVPSYDSSDKKEEETKFDPKFDANVPGRFKGEVEDE